MSLEPKALARAPTLPGLARPLGPDTSRLPLPEIFGVQQLREIDVEAMDRRVKIWDLHPTFHCSIIGTCLTTGELKTLLSKLDLVPKTATTDHELHKAAVVLAGMRSAGSKLLNKTLDRKFRRQIAALAPARSPDQVRALWEGFLERGDIPGGYWTVLTHPATSEALVRRVFGEIHMLSHLVGAANRADIGRLRELEAENADLLAKVERQQTALRDAVVARDRKIRDLQTQLAAVAASGQPRDAAPTVRSDDASSALLADADHRLARSERRAVHLERRTAELEQRESALAARVADAETEAAQLGLEAHALETQLAAVIAPSDAGADAVSTAPIDVGGATLLYVGGRTAQLPHLRALVERMNGILLHHSGGTDDSLALLPASISRAAAVLFPVDCVSHAAMFELKRVCKQAGKPYLPLRNASLAALLRGLAELHARQQPAEA